MATFNTIRNFTLNQSQKNFLLQGLATQVSDSRDAVREIENGLAAARSQSNNSGNTGTGTGGTSPVLISGPIGSMLGALYDRYRGEAFRLGKETINTLVGDIVSAGFTLNMVALGTKLKEILKGSTKEMMEEANEIDDKIIKVVNANSMFAGQVADNMREEMRDVLPLAQMMGVSVEDFLGGAESLFKAQGRMVTYSQDTLKYAVTVGKAYTENATDVMLNVDNFRNVGIGLADASRDIERIGKSSVSLGLNAKETTKTVMANLDKMNQYGFKNGIEGLSRMVMQAQALKINMDNVFKIAEKVFDPEGAIELTAGLQAIGGAFGDLADPMKAMFDATNNVEGLQDAFIKAASSLAVYNEEQGRFIVSGNNLRRAKAMADLYGISLNEITNAATKGAAKLEAMSQLQMFGNLTEQQQEFVSNMSQMKDGKIGIEVPKSMMSQLGLKESFVELGNLTSGQITKIKEMQEEMASMSTEEIAYEQMNTTTNILNTLTSIKLGMENYLFRTEGAKLGRRGMRTFDRAIKDYGPGGKEDLRKQADDLFKEYKNLVPDVLIEQYNRGLDLMEQQFPLKRGGNKIPDNLITPNPIYRDYSKATAPVNGRYDVYFHASSNLVTPFLTAMEKDAQMRKNFSDAITNPSYLTNGEVVT